MSLELIMNADGTLNHGAGSPITGGTFTITSVPSVKNKAEGKGVYRGDLIYTFAGGSHASTDPDTVATLVPQTISPSATKAKADGSLVIRLGDNGTMNAQGTSGGSPVDVSGPVEVDDAGQTKAKAE
jgi:hypothetical protein